MIPKPFDEITKADIDALIAAGTPEGRRIEYKLTLPGNSDGDTKEFLADVSSFSNAAGGDLLYGVAATNGVPTAAPGLAVSNADAEILRLESKIQCGIDPRIQGLRTRKIDGGQSGPFIIIRVPQSWSAPHMIRFAGSSRFFTRNSAGKYQMDVGEIRAAFLGSESVIDRVRRFRDERLGRIVADEAPLRLLPGAHIVLHIVPFLADPSHIIAPSQMRAQSIHFPPLVSRAKWTRFNIDGFVSHGDLDSGRAVDYCQLFRNGSVEAVDTDDQRNCERKLFASIALPEEIIDATRKYLTGLASLNVATPLVITVSLLGFRGYELSDAKHYDRFNSSPIDRDVVILPEVVIDEYPRSEDVDTLLRPIFDAMWNAMGFEKCMNFNNANKWAPRFKGL